MAERLQRSWACFAVLGAVGLTSRASFGAPNDAAALKLRDDAIYTDYLATNFASAASKLQRGLALCNAAGDCGPAVRARLLCDLGVMDFLLQKPDEGRAQFAAALREDPTLTLDNDLSSVEVQREFAAAKAGGSAASDCPPAFPGCRSTTKSTACVSSDECSEGQTCADGICTEPDSTELAARAQFIRNWLSVAFQADALLMPSASNACAGGTGYTCFGGNGSYDPDTPLVWADDQVNGGVAMATSRVLLGYDRAFTENVTFGARLGYALAGGPRRPTSSSFMPIHVEARAAYWFGHNPMARSGLRLFVLAAGGMAEVDASVPVDVYASAQAYQDQQSQAYRAWKKTGLGFAALGGGGMVAITPSTGIAFEAKAMEMFPTPATGFGLQLAYLVGL